MNIKNDTKGFVLLDAIVGVFLMSLLASLLLNYTLMKSENYEYEVFLKEIRIIEENTYSKLLKDLDFLEEKINNRDYNFSYEDFENYKTDIEIFHLDDGIIGMDVIFNFKRLDRENIIKAIEIYIPRKKGSYPF